MKRMSRILLLFAVAFSLICLPLTVYGATVKLNKKSATITAGSTIQLKLKNNKKKVKWTSSNKKIATVSSKGLVKGKNKGTCKITAAVGKKRYVCKLTVTSASSTNPETDTGDTDINKYFKTVTITNANVGEYLELVVTPDSDGLEGQSVTLGDRQFSRGWYPIETSDFSLTYKVGIPRTETKEFNYHTRKSRSVKFHSTAKFYVYGIESATGTITYVNKAAVKISREIPNLGIYLQLLDGTNYFMACDKNGIYN